MDDRIFVKYEIEEHEYDFLNSFIEDSINELNYEVEENTELKWDGEWEFNHPHMQVTYEWENNWLIFSFHYTTEDISIQEDKNLEEQTNLFIKCIKDTFREVYKVRGTFSNGEKVLEKI